MGDLYLPTDPFNTAADRAMLAAGYSSGAKFNEALDAAAWAGLTPAEQRDMLEFHGARADNAIWDQMLLRQQATTRSQWDNRRSAYITVPFTDSEKAAERRKFQDSRR